MRRMQLNSKVAKMNIYLGSLVASHRLLDNLIHVSIPLLVIITMTGHFSNGLLVALLYKI